MRYSEAMKLFRAGRNCSGVTLTELLVVITIIGILITAFGISFEGWRSTYRIESQAKDIYADLMDARTRAMTRNRTHFVTLEQGQYQMYEDLNENNTLDDAALWTTPKKLNYSFTLKKAGTGTLPVTLSFDTRGLMSPQGDFYIEHDVSPDYDCVLITQARIRMGKLKTDKSGCDEK